MRPGVRLRLGIFGRVYLFGLSMLVAPVIGLIVLIVVLIEPTDRAEEIAFGTWTAKQIASSASDAERLATMRSLASDAHVRSTVYDAHGAIVATTQDKLLPLDSLTLERLQSLPAIEADGNRTLLVRVQDGSGAPQIVALRSEASSVFLIGATETIAAMIALALLAWPLARSLSVPIRQLSRTLSRFGAGEIALRASTDRNDEIGDLARSFNDMADRISRLLHAEKLLMAGVAHELRTPLQRIRIALELAEDGEQPTLPHLRYVQSIAQDLGDIERIVSDVLTVARLETASSDTTRELLERRERVPASALLEDCAARFRATHEQRQLELNLVEPLPEVHVEPRLFMRAIGNLLDNAHKYSPPDRPVELRALADDGRLVITICDHGVGIAAEHGREIFEPFYRADSARSRSSGGAGLGLTLVKSVVEAHGGTVGFSSTPNDGTTFHVELPAKLQGTPQADGELSFADQTAARAPVAVRPGCGKHGRW